jgi:mono/diheme cytochrome c family protein
MIKKLSLVFLLVLSACDGGPGQRDPNPLHLPPQGFVGDAVKGEKLYSQNCLGCHGSNGLGTNQGPPLVNKTYNPRHHADLAFHLAVRNGVRSHHWKFGDMKPIPNLSPEKVEHIVQYVRAIQRNAGIK